MGLAILISPCEAVEVLPEGVNPYDVLPHVSHVPLQEVLRLGVCSLLGLTLTLDQ